MPSSNTSRIRLFASVDLIGSTAYKNSFEQTDRSNGQKSPPWYKVFEEFYLQFVDALKGQCQASSVWGGTQAVGMEFFKAIGDELVFQQTIETHREAIEYIKALRASLAEYNEKLKGRSLPLRVKGSAWIAGFPINNAEIELPDGRRDFLGPSIDAGFRISKFASERKWHYRDFSGYVPFKPYLLA